MILSMFLAHLMGDYILQWDNLALWKSRELKGVAAHCLIVFVVTWLFAIPFGGMGWWGVLFISITHFLIDASQLKIKPPVSPLARFLLDQIAHIMIIFVALVGGGYLAWPTLFADLTVITQSQRLLLNLIGYAFVTMPAWVLVKFAAYGLVLGTAPEFPGKSNKYLGILERILITTFIVCGQFLLALLVVMPRLVMERPDVMEDEQRPVYLAELLGSVTLAVMTGLFLSRI